nr:MAG TPA: hypothetical protein [Microviridae sp.]
MRHEQLTILSRIDIRNILMSLTVLGHILENITNTSLGVERINPSTTNARLPKITNLPPIKRAVEKNSMEVHTVSRLKTSLASTLTVSELYNKNIRKANLAVTITTGGALFTKTRMLTKTIHKATNSQIRLFLSLFINLWLNRKSAKQTLLRTKIQTLHNMVSTEKPLLLPLFQTFITMTTRNMKFKILTTRKTLYRNTKIFSKLFIMRIDNGKLSSTHRLKVRTSEGYSFSGRFWATFSAATAAARSLHKADRQQRC